MVDHLPLPHNPSRDTFVVSCYCTERYDGKSFEKYPERQGWRPRSYEEWHEIFANPPKEFLAFLQTWQFFGMLGVVCDRPIQLSEFTRRVDDSGPLAITTARLLPLLKDWLDHDGPAAYQQPLHKLHPS